MNKKWSMILGIVACSLLALCISYTVNNQAPEQEEAYVVEEKVGDWNGKVISTSLRDKLETSVEEVIYTGNKRSQSFTHTPNEGMQYVLVNVQLEPLGSTALNLDELQFQLGETVYQREMEDEFLTQHHMKSIGQGVVEGGSVEGTVLFQVPTHLTQEQVKEGFLTQKGVGLKLSLADDTEGNMAYAPPITESQYETELQLLDTYYKGSYTLESPYIVQDPYKLAPLTALAIFETEVPSEVEITIKGQKGGQDISYRLEGYHTHHEVPVLWLYGGMMNQITLTATTQDGEVTTSQVEVQTPQLPDYMMQKGIKTTQKEETMTNGLTLIIDDQRTVVDEDGEIRWYFSEPSAASGVEELLDNGHILMPLDAYARWTRFYEMDWLGKVYWSYANPESMNHDATELPNGNILTICGGDLVEIERGTGRELKRIRYEDYFENEGSLEVRTKGDYDWFHENTVAYHEGDVILSARNQHMVVKLDYETEKVEWILGSNSAYQPKQKKHYLEPVGEGFEWFYSQHQPSVLPDLDQNPDTMDLLLFDNGAHRSYEEETSIQPEEMYSRIVHYRIDEKAKTVEQIGNAGKELGLPYYSEIHSGAQYLEESGHYLGAFDASSSHTMAAWTDFFSKEAHDYTSKIVEFSPSGEVLHQIEVETPIYRAYRVKPEEMTRGFSRLGTVKGKFNVTDHVVPNKVDQVGEDGPILSDVIKLTYNEQYLEIVGWAYVEGLATEDAAYYLNLVGDKDTYTYPLGRDQRINIPVDRLAEGMEGDLAKGFKEPYLSLENVKEGSYELELLVQVNGKVYSQPLDYYFTMKDKEGKLVPVINNLRTQVQIEKNIEEKLQKGNYTEGEPLVVQDPYRLSPLTALVLFESKEPLQVSIEVEGKDEKSRIQYSFKTFETSHRIPVYGLYSDTTNKVKLYLTNEAGDTKVTELAIKTEKLPEDMMVADMDVKREKDMAAGMTFVASTYTAAIDSNGDIRWYLSDKTLGGGASPIRSLENGHIAIMSNRNVAPMYYQTGFYELDLLGKIYNEYTFQGTHHEIQELPTGNFIVAAEKDSKTTEDYIVELDRETGEVVRSWDIGEILGIEKIADTTYQKGNVSDKALTMVGASEEAIGESADYLSKHDWFHNNAVDYVEDEDALIISGRQQDMVLKIDGDTKEIKWILSDRSDTVPAHLQDKVLEPVGKGFMYQYGQHAAMQLPNGDVMLYDNGNFRSKDVDNVREANDNFSRGVIYRIDEEAMTVEQVWEYGTKRGKELYTPYIGDVDYIAENHYIINFGGILKDKAGNRYDSPVALFTNDAITGIAKVIEIKDDKKVSELTLTGPKNANTYRVERMPLYADNTGYTPLGEEVGRKGTLRQSEEVEVEIPEATVFPHTVQKIVDEGDRILIDVDFYDLTPEEKTYMILKKDKKTYAYPMTGDNMTRGTKVNKIGIPKGNYKVGILLEGSGISSYSETDYIVNIQ